MPPNPHKSKGERQDTPSLCASLSAVKLFNVKVHSIRTTRETPLRVYLSIFFLFLRRDVRYYCHAHMRIVFVYLVLFEG